MSLKVMSMAKWRKLRPRSKDSIKAKRIDKRLCAHKKRRSLMREAEIYDGI